MRKMTFPILFILVSVLACGTQEERILVRVGDETVKVKDFLVVYRPQSYPSEEAELEAKKKALDKLIEEKLLVAEARSRGYEEDPTIKEGLQDVIDRALINTLYMKEVVEKGKASRLDAKRFYEADKILLTLSIIHIDSDTLGYLIMEEFSVGVPFDTLAVRYSSHPTARSGGKAGTIPLSTFFEDPAFRELSSLKEGHTTLPIENESGGYDIYYLAERGEKEDQPPFKEMEVSIIKQIERMRQGKLSYESLERLLEEAKIEYNNAGLALLSKPSYALSEAELAVWTIKVDGKVTDSVGSMLEVYNRFPEGVPPQQLQAFAEYVVQRPALVSVALKRKLDRDPAVKEAIDGFIASQLRGRIYAEEVAAKIKVSPEEVRAYYDEHPDEFFVPERRKLSIIRTSSYSDIQQASSLLRQGQSFEEVARRFSDHQSAKRGGSIGFRKADDVSFKPFVEQGFKLAKGQYSRPFEVYNGFGIVKVDDVQPAYTKEFESEERRIERRLRGEKEKELKAAFIEELRGKIKVTVDEGLLLLIGRVEEPEGESS
jgi:parvulin-like peptidyl-prolyl isomerase